METLLLSIENKKKAEALKQFLSELNFVKKIEPVTNKSALKEALEEHEEMKNLIIKK